ncbi:MAG: polysaccharide biosynthesis tyrosine autokinase [Desulfobacteraceae bacterium]|nr:polysaccharide biosynthesis tyrosine autokinase [Desulfobacteraceae bacterium]
MKTYPLKDQASLPDDEEPARTKNMHDGLQKLSFEDSRFGSNNRSDTAERKPLNGERSAVDSFESENFLREKVTFFLQNRLTILAVTLLVFLAGVSYAFLATPIYRSDAIIQVEKREGKLKGISELSDLLNSSNNSTDAEIAILSSRAVLGQVVKELNLELSATPVRFPVIGGAVSRWYKGEGPAEPFLGLTSYGWGGEQIQLENLVVPKDFLGHPLTLVANANGGYKVFDPDGRLLLEGRVGELAAGNDVKVLVTALAARPGTRFRLARKSQEQAIIRLQKQVRITEKKRNSGIIGVTLDGSDPKMAAKIINTVIETYVRLDIERRSEESRKMLDFLTAQLPRISGELKSFESELTDYRSNTGSLGITLEGKAFLDVASKLEEQLSLLRLQKAELEQKFTGNHPTLIAVSKKVAELNAERKRLIARIKTLPSTELPAVQLERDSRVANGIYVQLLNRIQELSVAKAGTLGNVHIIDSAESPSQPVKPEKINTAILSLMLGAVLGIGVAFIRRSLVKGIEDPNEIERRLGVPVYCTIPHSEQQVRASKNRRRGDSKHDLLSAAYPQDPAIESIRSLRTSLQFALMDAPNNIITITGPSPGIGKSFVSANLTASLAEGGQRILLIDADMRKGHLHDLFGFKRAHGLSELISHEVTLEKAIHKDIMPGMDFIGAGIVPPNPSELLMSDRYRDLISTLSKQYDIVLVDTPPILAVTDASLVARFSGTCFLIIGYGRHQLREIDLALKRLDQAQRKVQGIVVNNFPTRYGKYQGYHYQYKY